MSGSAHNRSYRHRLYRAGPLVLFLLIAEFHLGTVVGPIIGGAFADSSATWRWGFYLNLVVGGVFAPVYLFIVPSHKPQIDGDLSSKLRAFDYLGCLLQAGSLSTITMAMNFGGTLYPWKSGPIIALFVVASLSAAVFVLQQGTASLTTLDTRIFPIHLLRRKEALLLGILMAANNAATFVLIYYIPLFFQFTRGSNSLRSGVELLPLIILITFTIMLNGGILSKNGFYKPWYVVGSMLTIIGGVLICKYRSSPAYD